MGLFETKVAAYTARLQADLNLKGFQADGVFGNIGHECNGFASMQEISPSAGRGGYGWCQWTGSRRVAFEQWCAAKNLAPSLDDANYGFLVHELQTTEAATLPALRATTTRDDAVRAFEQHFERAGVVALDSRIQWAIRAQTARVQAEGTKPVTDTSSTATAPVPTVPPTTDGIAQAIQRIEQKVEDMAAAQAVAHGVPAAIVEMIEMVINKIDLPTILANAIRNIDVEKLILSGISALTAKKTP